MLKRYSGVRFIYENNYMSRWAEHAMKDHGMKEDITPEFKEKVRGLIRTS